ncbi:MAG TPA: DUF4178 domain-containing protein [Acidimicrobiales bacterium]
MSVPNAPLERLGRWGQLGQADVVGVEGLGHRVCGWIAYDDEWVEYLLDDGRWLCVEELDGGLAFSVWEDQNGPCPPLDGGSLTHGGVTYTRKERYRARWLAAGVDGLTGPGHVTVVEFAGPGTALAAVEDWGDGGELSLGRWLDAATVTL